MKFTKQTLLHLLHENLNEMPMDFSTDDRPHQSVQQKLATGDTPLKKVPLPSTGNPNQNFQEKLGSERYKQVIEKLKRITGYQGTVQANHRGLLQQMMQAHYEIQRIENSHKEELEQLAIKVVLDEYQINPEQLDITAKIVHESDISQSGFQRQQGPEENPDEVNVDEPEQGEEPQQQQAPQNDPLLIDLERLNLEKAKRRLINALIQGGAKRGHDMYHLVSDEIRRITGNDNIINLYGVMMGVNDANYWQLSNDTVAAMSDSVAGKVQVTFPQQGEEGQEAGEDDDGEEGEEGGEEQSNKIKIVAIGVNFPVLVHEIVKGVLEVIGAHGQGDPNSEEDREMYKRAAEDEDILEKEMWDLRLGPAIWDRYREAHPEEYLTDEDKIGLQKFILTEIFSLPAKEFLVFMREVISGSDRGKGLMRQVINGIEAAMNQQDYESVMGQFNQELEDISNETEDDDLADMLGSLGINLSNDDDNEDEDDGGELVPTRR
jgi:hypothetical protein